MDEYDPYDPLQGKDLKIIKFEMMTQVAILGVGIGFGELALLNDAPRAATIKTIEDSQFAILSKADFHETMTKIYKKRYASQVSFLSSFPFLNYLTRKAKEKLCHHFTMEKCHLGQKIVTEGTETDFIYLIKKGHFEITKCTFSVPVN